MALLAMADWLIIIAFGFALLCSVFLKAKKNVLFSVSFCIAAIIFAIGMSFKIDSTESFWWFDIIVIVVVLIGAAAILVSLMVDVYLNRKNKERERQYKRK